MISRSFLRFWLSGAALMFGLASTQSFAATYQYDGVATTCTSTCDSFASLELGAALAGSIDFDVSAGDIFDASNITGFDFLSTSSAPLEPFDGTNPDTANPLPIDASVAAIRAAGGGLTTGGSIAPDGTLSGTVLFEFTVPPFSSNSAWVIFDLGSATAQVCLFFTASGCIPGATETVIIEGAFTEVAATSFNYTGVADVCTTTCDSFASLEVGTTLIGSLGIATPSNNAFDANNISDFSFLATSSAAMEPFNGTNPDTANPLPIDSSVAAVRAAGGGLTTGGTVDANGDIVSGTVLFEFTVPPFSSNAAWVIFDVGSGTAQVCLFFETSGCIPGATETVVINGNFSQAADTDGDGVFDDTDNCTLSANPNQVDADGDGFGNFCDADFNNDCVVNFLDLGLMRNVFFGTDPVVDMNEDGVVNFLDLGLLRNGFFMPPGPSANACN